uniref:Uncharacterized protein n=1 Tax=Trichogramma kaykai TaxID=54128 RepID=A0ABD2XRD5_9HYME
MNEFADGDDGKRLVDPTDAVDPQGICFNARCILARVQLQKKSIDPHRRNNACVHNVVRAINTRKIKKYKSSGLKLGHFWKISRPIILLLTLAYAYLLP